MEETETPIIIERFLYFVTNLTQSSRIIGPEFATLKLFNPTKFSLDMKSAPWTKERGEEEEPFGSGLF